jgi:L-fucono-1,5-lactonase
MPYTRIDAHHHLWKYDAPQYPWISENMGVLQRDFLVHHLEGVLAESGIDGVVSVQARQTLAETRWLLELAHRHDFIRGVVGWVALTDPKVGHDLEHFATHAKLKSVRHVLHDEPDDLYILREDFNGGIALLKDFGLRYDLLIFERHLPQTIQFVDRHPNQIFILDHIAKPQIKKGVISPWRENITELARRENVFCKLSGLITEANWQSWTEADLDPYLQIALKAFGPDRVIFGSDWPVILLASSYKRWAEIVQRSISHLSEYEQERILGKTATEVYRL